MTAIDYAALVERLHKIAADVGKNYCSPDGDKIDEAAEAIERLTQPGGGGGPVAEVQPGYKLVWRAPDWGLSTPVGTTLYPDFIVARLIAERDKYIAANDATLETLAKAAKAQLVLQEQVKTLRDALKLADTRYSHPDNRAALAATEPKEVP